MPESNTGRSTERYTRDHPRPMSGSGSAGLLRCNVLIHQRCKLLWSHKMPLMSRRWVFQSLELQDVPNVYVGAMGMRWQLMLQCVLHPRQVRSGWRGSGAHAASNSHAGSNRYCFRLRLMLLLLLLNNMSEFTHSRRKLVDFYALFVAGGRSASNGHGRDLSLKEPQELIQL